MAAAAVMGNPGAGRETVISGPLADLSDPMLCQLPIDDQASTASVPPGASLGVRGGRLKPPALQKLWWRVAEIRVSWLQGGETDCAQVGTSLVLFCSSFG